MPGIFRLGTNPLELPQRERIFLPVYAYLHPYVYTNSFLSSMNVPGLFILVKCMGD